MNLFGLLARGVPTPEATVPGWTLGCFRRRSITFYDGSTDAETRVLWLQSGGLTADLRLYAGRPRITDPSALARLDADTLARLAESEGGIARTRWDGERMYWEDWPAAFQTHAKWPEPGILRRVGDCLVEFAPSGVYVEDWRLERSGKGSLIGLELIDEVDANSGAVRHRGGGLVVAGRHAAFVRGRAEPIEGSAVDFARKSAGDGARLARLFGFEASYGTRAGDAGDFVVSASTSPWREGQRLLTLDGFSFDVESGLVIQQIEEAGVLVRRRFRADTLRSDFEPALETAVEPDGRAWLEREAETLRRSARR